jgi:hypothetical protein
MTEYNSLYDLRKKNGKNVNHSAYIVLSSVIHSLPGVLWPCSRLSVPPSRAGRTVMEVEQYRRAAFRPSSTETFRNTAKYRERKKKCWKRVTRFIDSVGNTRDYCHQFSHFSPAPFSLPESELLNVEQLGDQEWKKKNFFLSGHKVINFPPTPGQHLLSRQPAKSWQIWDF